MDNEYHVFDYYIELLDGSKNSKLFSVFKRVWQKFINFFTQVDTKNSLNTLIDAKNSYNTLKNNIPDVEEVFKNIIIKNKDMLNNVADKLFDKNINEEYIFEGGKWSTIFNRVKKGFIPSATFYPTLKIFEQFAEMLQGKKGLTDFSLQVGPEETIVIIGACFIYLLFKTIKEMIVYKKEEKLKVEKKEKEKEKTYERIHKVVDPVKEKFWSQEQMDQWIQQKLWSQDQLEQLIEKKIAEKFSA